MRFIARHRATFVLAATVAAATGAAFAAQQLAATDIAPVEAPADNWLKGLNGKHRQFFDSPTENGGIPLVHIMNFYDTYNKAYGVPDRDIDAVGTFYGATTFHGLNDAMWAKYRLGEYLGIKDPSGNGATANPWRSAPVVLGMTLAPASIESLQKRGATFIVCNNALTIFSTLLAQSRGLDPKIVYEDMKANILPGVELIPGMVVAIEQANRAGLAYHRQ
jgi:hypothetical protein